MALGVLPKLTFSRSSHTFCTKSIYAGPTPQEAHEAWDRKNSAIPARAARGLSSAKDSQLLEWVVEMHQKDQPQLIGPSIDFCGKKIYAFCRLAHHNEGELGMIAEFSSGPLEPRRFHPLLCMSEGKFAQPSVYANFAEARVHGHDSLPSLHESVRCPQRVSCFSLHRGMSVRSWKMKAFFGGTPPVMRRACRRMSAKDTCMCIYIYIILYIYIYIYIYIRWLKRFDMATKSAKQKHPVRTELVAARTVFWAAEVF